MQVGSFAFIAALVSSLDATRRRAMEGMKKAKESAEAASRAKDDFLAVLSHELRTPLTPALAAAASLAADPSLPAAARADLEMIRRNIELEARLIDDLLDLTRITHNKLRLSPQPLNVHALIGQVLAICRPDVEAKRLRVETDLRSGRPYVTADPRGCTRSSGTC